MVRSQKAFSLIQLMVAIFVSTVLLLAATYSIVLGSKERKLANAKVQLLTTEKNIMSVLKQDLDRAIKVTGRSISSMAGIQGRTNPRPTSERIDPLKIYVEEFGQFAARNVSLQSNHPQQPNAIDIIVRDLSPGTSEAGFMREVLERNDFFVLTSLEKTDVVTRVTAASTFIDATAPDVLHFPALPNLVDLSDYSSASLAIRAVSEIEYIVNDQGQLIRRSRRKSGSEPYTEKVLAEDVQEFKVDYVFGERNYRRIAFTPRPPGRERAVSTPSEINTNPPATWSDIQSVRVTLALRTPVPNGIQETSLTHENFSIHNGYLKRQPALWFDPAKYSMQSFDEGIQGSENCPIGDLSTHCNPTYSACFRGGDRGAADWAGYGDLTGPYCTCLGNSTENPARTVPGNLIWENPRDRTRLNACAAAFNGCENINLIWSHPGVQLACGCLTNQNERYKLQDDADPQLGYKVYEFRNMPTSIAELTSTTTYANNIRCERYQNIVPQSNGPWTCDAHAQRYIAVASNGVDTGPITQWQNTCACNTFDIDANNNVLSAVPIAANAKNLARLCGINTDNSQPERSACANTVDASGVLRLQDSTNPQGLSPEDALLCQCLRAGQIPTGQPGALSAGTIALDPVTNGGSSFAQNWDFRSARAASDPTPFAGGMTNTWGAGTDTAISTTVQVGNITTPLAGTCSQAYCQNGRAGISCAFGPPTPTALPRPPGWLDGDPRLSWLTTHAGYCSPRVLIGNANSANDQEVMAVRRRITGTADGAPLPDYCGGNQPDTSRLAGL